MDGRTRAEHSLIIQAKCRLHFPRFSADRIDKWFDRFNWSIECMEPICRLYLSDGLDRIDTRHRQPSFNLYSKSLAFYFALSCTFDTSTNNNNISLSLRNCQGDASESALLKAVEIAWKDEKTDTEEVRRKHKKMIEIPFNSTNKYQVSSSWRPCGIDVTFTHLKRMIDRLQVQFTRCKPSTFYLRNIISWPEINIVLDFVSVSIQTYEPYNCL